MKSTGAKWALAVAAVAVVVAAFIVAKGSGGNDSVTTTTTTATSQASGAPAPGSNVLPSVRTGIITVAGGDPLGGVKTLTYGKGDQVRIVVHSDSAEEVHITATTARRTSRPARASPSPSRRRSTAAS